MGSIQPHSVLDLPASKLPSFRTTAPSSTAISPIRTHSSVVRGVLIDPKLKVQNLLERFARFVGDIVGSEQVTFLAETPELGAVLVQAVQRPSSKKAPGSKWDIIAHETYADVADYQIVIVSHQGLAHTRRAHEDVSVSETAQKTPFTVLIQKETQNEDAFTVSLNLSSVYGGSEATKHLVKLVVAYLTSELFHAISTGLCLEPSRVNFDYFDAGKERNGHGIDTSHLLHAAFELNVQRRPDNVAIEYLHRKTVPARNQTASHYQRQVITYAELGARTTSLAVELSLLLHVLKGQWRPARGEQYAFPLVIPPSPDFFLAMLAVLKAGHAFCSLPADAPPDRLRAIVDDLGAPIVLGVGAKPWPEAKGTLRDLDQLAQDILWIDITNTASWRATISMPDVLTASEAYDQVSLRLPSPDDLAYLFYTSGSTGKPKGVLGSHRSAHACVESTLEVPLRHLPTGPRLRWLSLSAPSFDPVIIDTFVPLTLGGVLCCAERDLLLTDVEACTRELGATASYAVASLALLLRPEHMPTLKTLIVGGEAVNSRVVEKFAALNETSLHSGDDDRHLINAYGPTETTIFCTAELCTQATRSSVIGDALTASYLLTVDPDALDAGELRETPLGLAGELIVGGAQVACGYLNRPDATSRAFLLADNFPALGLPSGTILYRTGDKTRVVWSADGERRIDFLGRIGTDQIKLNGRRVELSEIENVLAGAQGVASAAVVVVKRNQEGPQMAELAAFVTVWAQKESDQDNRQSIVSRCREQAQRLLPDWMCPATFTVLEQLPGTASGKVDRAALVRLATTGRDDTGGMAIDGCLPVNPAAKTVIIQNFGGVVVDERPGPSSADAASIVNQGLVAALGTQAAEANPTALLLRLGLDSLRAILFLQSIRSSDSSIDLAMHEVLRCATVNDLIDLLETKRNKEKSSAHSHSPNQTEIVPPGKVVGSLDIDVDIAAIPRDDQEALYELPAAAKLAHFSHYCFAQCTEALNITAEDIEQVLPATNTQTRILYIATRPEFVDPTHYSGRPQTEHFVYQVPLDQIDPARLRKTVQSVLQRHDCFRAVFCSVEHPLAPFAVCVLDKNSKRAVIPTVDIICNVETNSETTDDNDASLWQSTLSAAQRAAESAMSPGRLGVTVTWVRSPDGDRQVLILSLGHAIFDGVMMAHIRDEIAAEYANPGQVQGSIGLPISPLYKAVELLLGGTDWTETMLYWMARFGGISNFKMGSKRPGTNSNMLYKAKAHLTTRRWQEPRNETHMRSAVLISNLSMDELASRASAQVGTTMAAVVQAAWTSVLAQTRREEVLGDDSAAPSRPSPSTRSRNLDVQFGNIVHGRTTQDLWQCMAPLLTTVPVHFAVEQNGPNPTNRDVCRLLAAQQADAAPYIDVPCPTLDLFELGHQRFDSSINLQAYHRHMDLPGWSQGYNLLPPYKEIDIGFPVMLEVWPAFDNNGPDWSGKMTLKCTYNVRKPGYEFLGEEGWVQGMLGAFENALQTILSEPDKELYIG